MILQNSAHIFTMFLVMVVPVQKRHVPLSQLVTCKQCIGRTACRHRHDPWFDFQNGASIASIINDWYVSGQCQMHALVPVLTLYIIILVLCTVTVLCNTHVGLRLWILLCSFEPWDDGLQEVTVCKMGDLQLCVSPIIKLCLPDYF